MLTFLFLSSYKLYYINRYSGQENIFKKNKKFLQKYLE